jgi:hypothetical protein
MSSCRTQVCHLLLTPLPWLHVMQGLNWSVTPPPRQGGIILRIQVTLRPHLRGGADMAQVQHALR